MPPPADLMIIMPVYNEQASVRKVVMEWTQEVANWTEAYVFLAINDGSTDGTRAILTRLQEQIGPRLEIVDQENMGHGQTCLKGYRLAVERGIPFVLQIDSDGQCDPQYFFRLWRNRERYEVIYARRAKRDDGIRRIVASIILKGVLFLSTGAWCVDANVPYRLMRTSILPPFLERIPRTFFLANVALAVLLRMDRGVRHGQTPIRFRERYGGEPKVPMNRFLSKAIELVRQLRALF